MLHPQDFPEGNSKAADPPSLVRETRKSARDDVDRDIRIVISLTDRDGSLFCPVNDVPWTGRRFPRRIVIHLLGRTRDSLVRTRKSTFENQAGSTSATPPAGVLLASAILICSRDAMLVGRGAILVGRGAMLVGRSAMLIGGKVELRTRNLHRILIQISN